MKFQGPNLGYCWVWLSQPTESPFQKCMFYLYPRLNKHNGVIHDHSCIKRIEKHSLTKQIYKQN